jgi:Cu+-exporting ATPase
MMGTIIWELPERGLQPVNAPVLSPETAPRRPITVAVEGMTCASCVRRVETAAQGVPGVEEASVNLATEKLTLKVGAGFDPMKLAEAIAASGYAVGASHRALGIEGLTDASSAHRVEAALRAVPGVRSASVNLATERASVEAVGTDYASLARAVAAAGYGAVDLAAESEADRRAAGKARERRALGRDAIIAGALTVVVVAIGVAMDWVPAVHMWMMTNGGMTLFNGLLFVLTSIVLFGPGLRFFLKGIPALWHLAPDMNSLVVLGTGAAYLYSTVATFFPQLLPLESRFTYFESAAVIATLILVGRYFEARAKGRTGAAVARLIGLQAKSARVERDGLVVDVPLGEVVTGDRIVVRPGDRIPVDGTVVEGASYVDESMISGEAVPVAKGAGAGVIGGTINRNGSFTFTATRVGGDTVLAGIIRMVEEAQGAKLPVQAAVDRVTQWFVPAVMAIAALTFVLWLAFGGEAALSRALINAVTVLIVACPCAMGLATPTSIVVGTGRAAELGVLFRRGDALQRLRGVATIAFDKTGTLTLGRPELTDLRVAEGFADDEVLAAVAAVEARSEHPTAEAIVRAAKGASWPETNPQQRVISGKARNLTIPNAVGFMARPGQGVGARVSGRKVDIGSARLMAALKVDVAALAPVAEALAGEGKSPVYAAIDGRAAAVLAVSDPVKPSAAATVARLRAAGLRVVMITGDHKATAAAIARRLRIDEVVAEVLPAGKVEAVKALKSHGPLAFVGDGINDAPALAAADVGIAIGSGTDVAIESADVVLLGSDLGMVENAIAISRATMRNIGQNLFWAFAYNVVLIPVAAGVLAPVSIALSPILAGAAMGLSSVFVVGNALRLRNFARRDPPRAPVANPVPQGA